MEKNEIATLIEALCEAPLGGQAEASAELQVLRRKAATALFEAAGTEVEAAADADRLAADLAALLSGSDVEAARRTLADQLTRLEAESARAFLDAIEQSAEVAPPHLVEELVSAEAAVTPRGGAMAPSLWSRIADGLWPAQRWRVVAACVAVLFASAAVLSLRWGDTDQAANPPASVAATGGADSAPAVAAGARAAPPPALAETQPCEPSPQIGAPAIDESRSRARAEKTNSDGGGGCNTEPGNRLADTAVKEALERAELARQAAAARAAADAAKVGTMQTDRGPMQADRLDQMFGAAAGRPAAAARSAPTAPPAAPPATR